MLDYWTAGLLDCWTAGLLDCWTVVGYLLGHGGGLSSEAIRRLVVSSMVYLLECLLDVMARRVIEFRRLSVVMSEEE